MPLVCHRQFDNVEGWGSFDSGMQSYRRIDARLPRLIKIYDAGGSNGHGIGHLDLT